MIRVNVVSARAGFTQPLSCMAKCASIALLGRRIEQTSLATVDTMVSGELPEPSQKVAWKLGLGLIRKNQLGSLARVPHVATGLAQARAPGAH